MGSSGSSLKAVEAADVDELRVAGASRRQAEAIVRRFHGVLPEADAEDAERVALENAFEDE